MVIRAACKKCKRKRTILLLDDAALTLTPEYLIEFFDIVRTLKSRDISPKVSVYPGTTEYGPRFHVGQDALPVNVWNIDLSDSHTMMGELFKKRLQGSEDEIQKNVLQLFMIVAFGIPRAFITMVSSYIDADSGTKQKRFNQVIEDQSKYLEIEYLSQAQKLRQYENIIHVGKKLFDTIIEKLVQINKSSSETKQVVVGLLVDGNEVDLLQERMIRFLVEAGLLHPEGKVSHGEGRIYERYTPHLIFLLKNKAFSAKSRGFNPKAILKFLARKNIKHPQREELSKLLAAEEIQSIKLNLPPCSSCGTTRITDSQKFCHHCGNELINESKFYRCMKVLIDDVPGITSWRKERIREGTNLKTIGDLYSHSQPAAELCKAFGIGKVISEDTYRKVERYIEEFLS